jgi:hypothetical protein
VCQGTTLTTDTDGCTNQTGIETSIGLKFNNYCLTNIPDYDLRNADADTFTECLNQCANSGADPGQPPCRAVAYNTQARRCWQKSGNATVSELQPAANTIMAFADDTAFLQASHSCPFANNTIHTDSNGMSYQILCGVRHKGDNYDPSLASNTYDAFHASSMDECLDYCSSNSPLCYGVLYSEGLDIGYRNCWPKNKNATEKLDDLVPDGAATTAMGRLAVNSTCSGNSYSAPTGKDFDTSCDKGGEGPDLKAIHADNLSDCIDECARYQPTNGNSECRNVMYQPTSQDGFLNCHLKYGLDNVTAMAQWHMAALTGENGTDAEGEGDTGNSSGGSSASNGGVTAEDGSSGGDDDDNNTALIAGAVAGPVVGVALIGGLLFWWCRKRRRGRRSASHEALGSMGSPNGSGEREPFGKGVQLTNPYPSQGPLTPEVKNEYYGNEQCGMEKSGESIPPLIELGSGKRDMRELPGSDGRYEMQG